MQNWLDWAVNTLYQDGADTFRAVAITPKAKPYLTDRQRAMLDLLTEAQRAGGAAVADFVMLSTLQSMAFLGRDLRDNARKAIADAWQDRDPMLVSLSLDQMLHAGADILAASEQTARGYDTMLGHLYLAIAPFLARASRAGVDTARKTVPMPDAYWDAAALRIDAGLVADLRDARAPMAPEVEDALSSGSWYLDLPPRSLIIGEGLQARALVVTPNQSGVLGLAVITKPGANRIEALMGWSLTNPNAAVLFNTPVPEFDAEAAVRQLSDFVRLVVAYRSVADRAQVVDVPMAPAKALLADRNWKARVKKASLFSAHDLRTPQDRFGRSGPRQAGETTWRLGWRSTVNGFFRMQPHGPRGSLRRLQWIEGYERGPKDAPTRTEIERLR
ncbi:hypothetical protein CRT60_01025 [Azospirillum palustre]|uniref:Uncharacterized protein n=1 Tax=Azospirillum palustre TaxID=2044885 RepID=A0A2B8BD19_9PROT|nr:hypothetical protein [Azospirillum palustre]PGH59244.1 hypothetical protein CRT60_01025 [Azospirillum palustre]